MGMSIESGDSAVAGHHARMGWRGVIPGVLLLAIAGLTLYAGRDLPAGSEGGHLGPGALPNFLSATLFGLGMIIAVEGFFRRRTGVPGSMLPAIVLAASASVFLLAFTKLGLAAATGLAVTIIAGYGLRTRPVAFGLVVAASVAAAVLLNLLS
ncbi:MAG: hypothetical protein ACLPKB_18640 [Xanthobacteraceae bacterium]